MKRCARHVPGLRYWYNVPPSLGHRVCIEAAFVALAAPTMPPMARPVVIAQLEAGGAVEIHTSDLETWRKRFRARADMTKALLCGERQARLTGGPGCTILLAVDLECVCFVTAIPKGVTGWPTVPAQASGGSA